MCLQRTLEFHEQLQMLVRKFVQEQRSNRRQVTAAQVLQFLIGERNGIKVAQDREGRYLPQPYKVALGSSGSLNMESTDEAQEGILLQTQIMFKAPQVPA